MHFKNKKGFTVVELIIVLAIIGILAAVLIPTFASIIRTAQVSSDNQLIRNLNTALAADHKSHPTLHDALKAAFGFGYDVSKINASCVGNEILYDSVNEVFCYFDSRDGGSVSYIPESQHEIELDTTSCAYWRIINEKNVSTAFTAPDENGKSTLSCGTDGMGWSCYLVTVPDGVTEIETNAGVDTGDTDSIVKVAFKNSGAPDTNTSAYVPPVVIRTTDGLLEIDAPKFTVHHYGVAIFLDVIAVGTASYHEFGYVLQAQIRTGRVVNEAGTVTLADGTTVPAGIVNLFLICNPDEQSFAEIIVAAAVGALLPALDRTAVSIPGGGMLVLKVEEDVVTTGSGYTAGNYDYIYLYKSGVEEQIVTSKAKVPDGTLLGTISGTDPITSSADDNATFVKGTDSIANSDSKTAAIQIANVPTAGGYDVDAPNIDVYPKDTYASIANTYGSNALFAGGTGTVNNPYLISKGSQFKNITGDLTDKHFRIVANIPIVEADFSNTTDSNGTSYYLIEELSGSLDGAGHRLVLPDLYDSDKDIPVQIISELSGTIKNLDVEFTNHGVVVRKTAQTSSIPTFDNVDVYGLIFAENNYGAYVIYSYGDGISFKDCDFYGEITSEGTESNNIAIFVGYNVPNSHECIFTFNNCNNKGYLVAGDATLFIANAAKQGHEYGGPDSNIVLNIINCRNEGTIIWTKSDPINGEYRPYNHFMSSNVQMIKQINIDGISYVKTLGLTNDQIAELNIDNVNIIGMQQTKGQSQLWSGTRLLTHTYPTMPGENYDSSSHFVKLQPDQTMSLVQKTNGTLEITKATRSVDYYLVTIKTYAANGGSTKVLTVSEKIDASVFETTNKYTTQIKNLNFVDNKWLTANNVNAPSESISFSTNDNDIVEYSNSITVADGFYYFNEDPYELGSSMYRGKPGKINISAFKDGKLVASAGLNEMPVVDLVQFAVKGENVNELYYPDDSGKSVWRQYYYITEDLRNGSWEKQRSTPNSSDYSTGFIPVQYDANNQPIYIYYLKTKSALDRNNDRLAIATEVDNNSVSKIKYITLNNTSKIDKNVYCDWRFLYI